MSKITEALDALKEFRTVLVLLGQADQAAMLDRPIRLLTESAPSAGTAEAAARIVIDRHELPLVEGESPLSALGWAMGNQITYEKALAELVAAALNGS